ncbi:MAG: protein translocase subunit SecF [Gammaproteobacteria bacterium]
MEFFHKVPHINFLGLRKFTFAYSIIVLIIAVVSLSIHGLNFAVDFTGGVTVQVSYPEPANLQQIRGTLTAAGYKDAIAQSYGTPREVLIRLQPKKGVSGKDTGNAVMTLLRKDVSQVRLEQVNFVGPEVGRDLATKGTMAFVLTLAGILIYIIFRFEWRLAVGGVLATLHDVVFVVGFFSIFHLEFDLNVLAAVLAVMGYSVNDTVVVFDRIREDFRIMRKGTPIEIINLAINQTLSRTIITSGTTLLVVIALFFLGGPVLHGFSVALLVGIIVGTYSSIYIASAIALVLGVSKKDLMVRVKEEKKVDDMP